MALSYAKRLLIDINGNDSTRFHTSSGQVLAIGYKRVVIGKRGPYIEFSKDQINSDVIFIPEDQKYRLESRLVYYHEWRSLQDHVKLYEQQKTVAYADYLVGMWYVSPFDLLVDDKAIIQQPKKPKDLFK